MLLRLVVHRACEMKLEKHDSQLILGLALEIEQA
jgi:hypothetical protein